MKQIQATRITRRPALANQPNQRKAPLMSSYESLIGKAILSSDPAERQAAEDAVAVKMYASKALRDESQFVVIEFGPGFGSPMPMDAATWDGVKDSEKVQAELARTGARVLDGRILFAKAKPARRTRAAAIEAQAETLRETFGPPAS